MIIHRHFAVIQEVVLFCMQGAQVELIITLGNKFLSCHIGLRVNILIYEC